MLHRLPLLVVAILCSVHSASAIELIGAVRESVGTPPAGAPTPCALTPRPYPPGGPLNGTCANYRWFNLCSGYIWIYGFGPPNDSYGTIFRASDGLSCVVPGNTVKRVITYHRNVVPNYNQTIDLFLEADPNGDGCMPFTTLAQRLNMDPALRWNCSNFGTGISAGVSALVVRFTNARGTGPTLVTDSGYSSTCDPNGNDHSFYYPSWTSACIPWRNISPTGRGDNLLSWLIVDSVIDATERASWGKIKGLYR